MRRRAELPRAKMVFELDRRERAIRALLVAAIVLVHALLILWLGLYRTPVERARAATTTMIGLSPVLEPGRPAKAVSKPLPVTLEQAHPIFKLAPLKSLDLPAMATAAAPAAETGAGGGCGLTEQVRTAILADPNSMAELAALPVGVRTEADAVTLWNGEWFDPATTSPLVTPSPPASLPSASALRQLIERLVAAAPAECRDAEWAGPQFIPIPQGPRFTMLVIGSGAWRWRDLIEPPASCVANGALACAPPGPQMSPAINYLNDN